MKDYSQNKEQAQILRYFGYGKLPHPTDAQPGCFLSIGENDGEIFSNVRALAELNWSGVCVEPAPVAYSKLAQLYKREDTIHAVQAAITTQDGPIEFHSSGTHLKQGDTDLLSTTRPEEIARWKKSGEVFTKTTARGITFATLMRETGVTHFDFITIDAEGADYSILSQIDLKAVDCRLLCVEVNARGDAEFTAYAARHGMRLVWSSYENRIYSK